MSLWHRSNTILLLVRGLLLGLGLGEPGKEGLGGLANLLGGGNIGVLLAGLGSPLGNDVLADEVVVVVQMENLNNSLVHLGVLVARSSNETLSATEKSLLVTIGGDNLDRG